MSSPLTESNEGSMNGPSSHDAFLSKESPMIVSSETKPDECTAEPGSSTARIGILVVAYNASTTLTKVLDRIPADFRSRITKVLVSDDHSPDETFNVGVEYLRQTNLPIEVVHQSRNLGYGGNQKAGYHWAIANDLDVVVMLHGDGQYAPEMLPQMVAPIVEGDADAVFGSRMIEPGAARDGGMPLYKFAGNKALTKVQNSLTGATLSEWHSGYRAYRVGALKDIPFERNDQGFRFDTQIILQLLEAQKKIVEIPIPTFYGDEICYVNGTKYAKEITADVVRNRLHRLGLGSGDLALDKPFRRSVGPVEQQILNMVSGIRPIRILDISHEAGDLGRPLLNLGHDVVHLHDLIGLSLDDEGNARSLDDRVDEFEDALEKDAGAFDMVIALDVLVRLRDPERMMRILHSSLRPFGKLLTSVPNVEHWYPRLRFGAGQFDYDRRGVLDRSHFRMFSDRSVQRLATRTGWWVKDHQSFGLPFQVLGVRSPASGPMRSAPRWMRKLDAFAARKWPSMFGYVLCYELEPAAPRAGERASWDKPDPELVDLGIPIKIRS
jgi:glycosyltransferase involved in cell wall biosynthesis